MRCVCIWWFPEIAVPPVIIHFNGTFPYKQSIWGYPHLWKPPYNKPLKYSFTSKKASKKWIFIHFTKHFSATISADCAFSICRWTESSKTCERSEKKCIGRIFWVIPQVTCWFFLFCFRRSPDLHLRTATTSRYFSFHWFQWRPWNVAGLAGASLTGQGVDRIGLDRHDWSRGRADIYSRWSDLTQLIVQAFSALQSLQRFANHRTGIKHTQLGFRWKHSVDYCSTIAQCIKAKSDLADLQVAMQLFFLDQSIFTQNYLELSLLIVSYSYHLISIHSFERSHQDLPSHISVLSATSTSNQQKRCVHEIPLEGQPAGLVRSTQFLAEGADSCGILMDFGKSRHRASWKVNMVHPWEAETCYKPSSTPQWDGRQGSKLMSGYKAPVVSSPKVWKSSGFSGTPEAFSGTDL